jgi:hypothetical protein
MGKHDIEAGIACVKSSLGFGELSVAARDELRSWKPYRYTWLCEAEWFSDVKYSNASLNIDEFAGRPTAMSSASAGFTHIGNETES